MDKLPGIGDLGADAFFKAQKTDLASGLSFSA